MICIVCGTEIDESLLCPVCGSETGIGDGGGKIFPWVLIYTTNTFIDAEMYKANIESGGIPVQILSQVDSTRQLTIGDLAIVKIYVPSHFACDAIDIINAINSGNDAYIDN